MPHPIRSLALYLVAAGAAAPGAAPGVAADETPGAVALAHSAVAAGLDVLEE